jgi:hypothetical protein
LLALLLPAYGDQLLLQRSVRLLDATPGVSTTYTVSFTLPAAETLGSIQMQFCSNDPLIGYPCTAPAGFDLSGAVIASQSGETGFTIGSGSTANVLVLTRPASAAAADTSSYSLSGVINPSAQGSYYVRLQTFASTDASGPENDHGGLVFAINPSVPITAEVPPYILFCAAVTIDGYSCDNASGSYVNFGSLSPSHVSSAQSQLLVATNAASGYNITVGGTTLTSGNNIINALASADVSRPGVSQFGMNLRDNSDPVVGQDVVGPGNGQPAAAYNVPDTYLFRPGDILASSNAAEDYRKYTASYIVNISKDQPTGVYASTLSYVAAGNF